MITPPPALKNWPAKVAKGFGFCTLSTVGFLDLPFSLTSDTLFVPYDMFMLNQTDQYFSSGEEDQADSGEQDTDGQAVPINNCTE